MEADLASGKHNQGAGISPMSYPHNDAIHMLILEAKRQAWAAINSHPDIIHERAIRTASDVASQRRKEGDYSGARTAQDQATQLLEMKNK